MKRDLLKKSFFVLLVLLFAVTSFAQAKIDINTATEAQLSQLPGIGPAIAKRIVDFRETNGKFEDVKDLLKVKGIGPGKLKKIKDMVEIGK